MTVEAPVALTIAERVATITIDRPAQKNALDRSVVDALSAHLATAAAHDEVRVIAVTGAGADFCAGADLAALERMIDAPEEVHRADAAALGELFEQLRAAPVPTVAVVRGRALAGGAGVATACDIVLADEGAQFGYPEVRIGFVPAMVMTMLRRAVGEKVAADLVLTGRLVDAHEAMRSGLVSRVIQTDTFDATVHGILRDMAKSPPTAMQLTKALFHALDGQSFATGIRMGIAANVSARQTDDFKEGVRRFVARSSGGAR